MLHLRNLIVALAITVVAGTMLSGCLVFEVEEDPATATCNDYDSYLATCSPTCAVEWDCEYWYDGFDLDTQYRLDECSICLEENRYSCTDCYVGGASCFDLLTSHLGMVCSW